MSWSPNMRHPIPAAFFTGVTPYLCDVPFFIPERDGVSKALGPLSFSPPEKSRAASAKTASRGVMSHLLGLLKPHFCKLSASFQRVSDTIHAVAHLQSGAFLPNSLFVTSSNAFTLHGRFATRQMVDRAVYGGMCVILVGVNPACWLDRCLSPTGLFPWLAQLVEHLYRSPSGLQEVAGSSPALGAKFMSGRSLCQL